MFEVRYVRLKRLIFELAMTKHAPNTPHIIPRTTAAIMELILGCVTFSKPNLRTADSTYPGDTPWKICWKMAKEKTDTALAMKVFQRMAKFHIVFGLEIS